MALGIDIYRYQTVTDWAAVKRHGVSFVYVKGSDGGGPAMVRADGQTRGAQKAGLPVGLYHYAQLSPSPEAQADVLTAEVRRLNATGLPPALDLEDPHQPGKVAREFVHRFLNRLRVNGFKSVCLYANTSMLAGIGGPEIDDDPDVVIWAAAYGPNDGRRHSLTYRGRVNIHQYTSVGTLPGISGRVDLNESLTALPDAYRGDNDMPLTNEDARLVAEAVWDTHRPHLDADNNLILPMWMWAVGANMGAWLAAQRELPAPDTGGIVQALTTQLVPIVREVMEEQASRIDRVSDLDDTEIAEAVARRIMNGPAAPPVDESTEG